MANNNTRKQEGGQNRDQGQGNQRREEGGQGQGNQRREEGTNQGEQGNDNR